MKVNIFSSEWCDLVFENKNKEYGAYESRQLENKRTLIAIISASLLFILVFSFPLLIKAISPSDTKANTEINKISDVILVYTPPAKTIKIQEDIIPAEHLRKTIKFVEPVITPGDDNNDLPPVDNLKDPTATIGGIDNPNGNSDPTAPMPKDIPKTEIAPEPAATMDYASVEIKPDFPGGYEELIKFILKNIQYPPLARSTNISGTVNVLFVVRKDGEIGDIKLLRSIGGGCDEEAMRVVKSMPRWQPGKQNGKPVAVSMVLPVKFTLK